MTQGFLSKLFRTVTAFARSIRLWMTFGAVVLIFAITGPYKTAETLGFAQRLAYWFLIHATSWSAALLCAIIADILLAGAIASLLGRLMIGSIIAAAPIGGLVTIIRHSWFDAPLTIARLVDETISSLPLTILFCAISYMTMVGAERSGYKNLAAFATPPDAPQQPTHAVPLRQHPALVERLKPENRGSLLHVSVQDHYVIVQTSRGREMILMRLSDARKETDPVDGLQVHRSHWVAKAHVREVLRQNGKRVVVLADGVEIPVSRTYADGVKRALG